MGIQVRNLLLQATINIQNGCNQEENGEAC